jgi:hypothetical protein
MPRFFIRLRKVLGLRFKILAAPRSRCWSRALISS